MDQDEHQKQKPTRDGKQSASHSYSTRSRAKRTSHSDDDCSGSQAQEPPLKRQTRPGAKQAGESVGINNNDDATADSNAVGTISTVEEYAPAQTALQNDLVLESLFSYMNRSDLLSCRIVNKKWQWEATTELQRRKLVIGFLFRRHENKMRRNIAFQEICRRVSECRTPSLLSSFKVKTACLKDMESAGATSFFSTVGNKLKHLALHLNYSRKIWHSFSSSSILTHFQDLLFRQAPNLEFLEIEFDFPDRWKYGMQALNSPHRLQNCNNEFRLLPNLKTFIVSGTPPLMLCEDVIKAAVNLRSFGGDWSTCINYLMGAEGRTKIHLLKRLSFVPDECYQYGRKQFNFKLVESFLTEHKQNLRLESFDFLAEFIHRHAIFSPRYVGVVNQILECSSGSLQKLIIESGMSFVDVPSTSRLPNLKEICFDCGWISPKGFSGNGFFPVGFNMNISFPNVASIVLLNCAASMFRLFVSRMEIEMTEPVPSVQRITMIAPGKNGSSNHPLASDLHHVFPNLVSISYADSAAYYRI